jgi:hypothetical protein
MSISASAAWLKLRRRVPRRRRWREGLAGHEGDAALMAAGRAGGCRPGAELQPEEQPAGGRLPVGQGAEVAAQGGVEGVALGPVEIRQPGKPRRASGGFELLQHQPLAEAVAVQVGGLLEAHQR